MTQADIERQLQGAKPGDILLFYRARGINRIISAFSRSRYYHVGIYAGDFWIVEARPEGIVRRDLRQPGGGQHFRVIQAPGGREVGEKALEYALAQIGGNYAVLSVFALVFDRTFNFARFNLRQRDRFSCGELVVKAFAHAGQRLFPRREAEVIAPWDFTHLLPRNQTRLRGRGTRELLD